MVHIDFRPSDRSSLGIEWELALVDAGTGELVSAAETVLGSVGQLGDDPDHPRIKQELLLNTVEIVTGVCPTVRQARADLDAALVEVRRITDPLGLELFCAGTHPFSRWSDQKVTDRKRYATLIDRTQWWGRQMVIYGVHVHVGIRSVHKVLPILNAMLNHYPHLQALSASSPYWGGLDTGYASNRALLFQQLPTAGLPFQFQTWQQFEGYVTDMLTTGVIDDYSEIRWDLRPSPLLGTLENRVCDGLPTLDEVTAVAALVQCLVDDLDSQLDDGATLPTMPPWHVQENKWRSARYGLEAEIILDAAGRERLVTDDLLELLDRLDPVARRLDCVAELGIVERILATGASYQRQRAVAARSRGDLRAVGANLVQELRTGLPQLAEVGA